MIRELLQMPDERLTQVSQPVTQGAEAVAVAADLNDTLRVSKGYALAAPQIGHLLRLIVSDGRYVPKLMANPVVVRRGREIERGYEGCLSINHGKTSFEVLRHRVITVEFQDEQFVKRTVVLKGLAARIAQHEIDHLDGKLIG